MKFKTLFILLFATAIISLLTTCKKYPENDLWFKSPESAFVGGKFTSFTVDGVDSMPMWDAIYNSLPDHNGYGTLNLDPREIFFSVDKTNGTISCSVGSGSFHFFNNSKEIYMFFKMEEHPPLYFPKYNLFYTVEGNWNILKLTKSGTMRIQRAYNGKVYEMEFN
jgi:hypothetical protein